MNADLAARLCDTLYLDEAINHICNTANTKVGLGLIEGDAIELTPEMKLTLSAEFCKDIASELTEELITQYIEVVSVALEPINTALQAIESKVEAMAEKGDDDVQM